MSALLPHPAANSLNFRIAGCHSPNKDFSQGRRSYFSSIVIPLNSRIAGCQVPKPRCLNRQVPRPRCLSPASHSLDFIYVYIYMYIYIYSPNKDFSQGRGSYFSLNKDFGQGRDSYFLCIVIPHDSRTAGGQPRYLSLGT